LTASTAVQALRNPHLSVQAIALLIAAKHLMTSYQLRKELATHVRTPEAIALRLVSGLYWRDLARVGADGRTRPLVRRHADQQLALRLPSLALGERISLARIATPTLMGALRKDGNPRVIRALLENPRMTEGQLMPLVSSTTTTGAILGLIAADRRWGARYSVRAALARNARTPVEVAVRLLSGLRKSELRAVADHHALAAAVRRRARLLLGREL
jgi:hypothetical protein